MSVPQHVQQALEVLADERATSQERNHAYSVLLSDCQHKRTLNRVLAWIYLADVASCAAAQVILCAADRFNKHRHRSGFYQGLWQQLVDLHQLLPDEVPKHSDLARFKRKLGACLTSDRGGIIGEQTLVTWHALLALMTGHVFVSCGNTAVVQCYLEVQQLSEMDGMAAGAPAVYGCLSSCKSSPPSTQWLFLFHPGILRVPYSNLPCSIPVLCTFTSPSLPMLTRVSIASRV